MDEAFQRSQTEIACGSKEFHPPFPFPPGASRGGRVPPTPMARCAPAKSAGPHPATGSPHKRDCRPLVHPLRARGRKRKRFEQPHVSEHRLGTFYFALTRRISWQSESHHAAATTATSL